MIARFSAGSETGSDRRANMQRTPVLIVGGGSVGLALACELGRLPRPPRMIKKSGRYSPMRLQQCSQMWFDPILHAFARTLSCVNLRFRTRLETFETTGSGVHAKLIDLANDRHECIEAQYLVGC